MKLKFYFFIILFLFNVNCTPDECKLGTLYYEFIIPSELTPKIDTYEIGDTVLFESFFQDSVYEKITNQKYLLKDKLFHPFIQIVKLDTFRAGTNALKFFDLIYDKNYFLYDSIGRVQKLIGQYHNSGNEYSLRLQFVPQRAGLYYFRHYCVSEIDGYIEFDEKCSNMGVKLFVELNSGDENNMYLIDDCEDENYKELVLKNSESSYFKSCGYCFYVE